MLRLKIYAGHFSRIIDFSNVCVIIKNMLKQTNLNA